MRPGPHGGRRGGARAVAAALALASSLPLAGCGVGEGEAQSGTATLTVTRDYGAERLLEASAEDPSASETVLRLLDRESDVETRYGGAFVQSIDGFAGGTADGRRSDWFFYLNGVESPIGAAEVEVLPGDRVWWDLHDWTSVMRVPAVVGSFPEPFVNGAGGAPVELSCLSGRDRAPCRAARAALARAGAEPRSRVAERGPRVVVGPWSRVRGTESARALEGEPAESHVFARFAPAGEDWELVLFDRAAGEGRRLGPGAGLVAAVGERGPPTWFVTGTDRAGVERAADALSPAVLGERFAVAVAPQGEIVPLPER